MAPTKLVQYLIHCQQLLNGHNGDLHEKTYRISPSILRSIPWLRTFGLPTMKTVQCNMHRADLIFETAPSILFNANILASTMLHNIVWSISSSQENLFCHRSSALVEADRSIAHIWIILQAHSIGKGPFAHWLQYYRLKVLPIINPIRSRQSKSSGIMQRPIDRGLICLYTLPIAIQLQSYPWPRTWNHRPY
jgi:hypothetical protein